MREAAPNRRISCGQGAKMAGSAKPSNPTMKTPRPAARAAAATLTGSSPPPAMMPSLRGISAVFFIVDSVSTTLFLHKALIFPHRAAVSISRLGAIAHRDYGPMIDDELSEAALHATAANVLQ